MRIGASLVLIALGAILTWGVSIQGDGFNLNTIGIILMAVGAIGLVLTLVLWSGRGRGDDLVVRRDDDLP